MSIFDELKATGAPMSNNCSDLYVEITPATTIIINAYKYNCSVTRFMNEVTSKLNYEIPFAYDYKKLGKL